MPLYVLDSDILTLHEEGNEIVDAHVEQHAHAGIATTIINVDEKLSGWYSFVRRSKAADRLRIGYGRLADTIELLKTFHILTLSTEALERYEALKAAKIRVRKMDLLIAAIVLEENAILVTRNTADFSQVPGLNIVDWSKE
jgi:tRNA(fMet)-specific endonuclease VapC